MSDYNTIKGLLSRIEELERRQKELEQAPRSTRTSIDRGGIRLIGEGAIYAREEETGAETLRIGEQWDGTFMAAPLGGPTPPTPSAPIVTPITGGLQITWDGSWADSLYPPMDFSRIEVHISLEAQFEATAQTLIGTIETPQGANIQRNLTYQQHYVKFICRSLSGKASKESTLGSGTPLTVTKEDIDFEIDIDAIKGTQVFYGDVQPVDPKIGDLWLRTPGNVLYRLTYDPDELAAGNTVLLWEESRDQGVTQAVIDAANAEIVANSKSRVFTQATAPTGMTMEDAGDLWIETDAGNRLHTWDGDSWEPRLLGNMSISPNSLVASNVIATGTVTAALIDAFAITADKIATEAITATKIAAGAITAEAIALGVISTNRVRNPGFEDFGFPVTIAGTYSSCVGWTVTYPEGVPAGGRGGFIWSPTVLYGRSGVGAAYLGIGSNANNGTFITSDAIPVTPGMQFKISFYARNQYDGYRLRYVHESSTNGGSTWSTVLSSQVVPLTEHARFTATWTVPVGVTHMRLRFHNDGHPTANQWAPTYSRGIAVDDVSVIQIGAPAMEVTGAGIRMWNSTGDETVTLSGSLATIVGGTFRTAVSGRRIEILGGEAEIRWWTAESDAYFGSLDVDTYTDVGGTKYGQVFLQAPGYDQLVNNMVIQSPPRLTMRSPGKGGSSPIYQATATFDAGGTVGGCNVEVYGDFIASSSNGQKGNITSLLDTTVGRHLNVYQNATVSGTLKAPNLTGHATYADPPHVAVQRTTNWLMYVNAWSVLPWESATEANASMWIPEAVTRLYAPVNGLYDLRVAAQFWGAGLRYLGYMVNGANRVRMGNTDVSDGELSVSTYVRLIAGQYVEIVYYSTQGTDMAVLEGLPRASMTWRRR